MYGGENWILTERSRQDSKLEMKFFRKVLEVRRIDKKGDEDITQEMGVESAKDALENKKLILLGHLILMGEDRQEKKIGRLRRLESTEKEDLGKGGKVM